MTTGPSIGIAITPGDELSGRPVGSRWSGKRLFIAILLFLNLFITFMQQIILSVAAPAIARDFRWDAGEMGLLFLSYQWTHCLFLLVWGPMSDRIGTHWINGLSVTIWSIAGMLTGVAATFGGMLATRLALGAGEAASFPTSAKVVRQWFPASERGLATAIFNAGTFAGPAFISSLGCMAVAERRWADVVHDFGIPQFSVGGPDYPFTDALRGNQAGLAEEGSSPTESGTPMGL